MIILKMICDLLLGSSGNGEVRLCCGNVVDFVMGVWKRGQCDWILGNCLRCFCGLELCRISYGELEYEAKLHANSWDNDTYNIPLTKFYHYIHYSMHFPQTN